MRTIDAIIEFKDNRLIVPGRPEIPCIPGDGIGPEVWEAAREVLNAAVEACYGGRRGVTWLELPAGEAATRRGLDVLPSETLESVRLHRVAIKGPAATPVGRGHRSINVALRQDLDLFASVRPVRYFEGVETPVKNPSAMDVVIFRENTEDVFLGMEFFAGSEDAAWLTRRLRDRGYRLPGDAGIGIKVISREKTRRFVRAAVEYALAHGRGRVTLVHKGNIMKATEGAFVAWGYDIVREEFRGRAAVLADLAPGESPPESVVVVDERIADAMFQDLLLSPRSFDVIAAPNLNGDYLSDAAVAQVGGLGVAPGGNIGIGRALFEPAHGTAPDIAGKGIANPGSMILSGAMMLEFIGWGEASRKVVDSFASVLRSGRMTGDLARGSRGKTVLSTGAFGEAVALEAASRG
jgi:isocitrate dehydrogenase